VLTFFGNISKVTSSHVLCSMII